MIKLERINTDLSDKWEIVLDSYDKDILNVCNQWASMEFIYQKDREPFKETYHNIQKSYFWTIAKCLLIHNYLHFEKRCIICGKDLLGHFGWDRCQMHHKQYNKSELFNPYNIIFLHFGCHKRLHKEYPKVWAFRKSTR
jgi:hypothetical protein